MRWAEDVADQGCCVGADEGSDIGEIVLPVAVVAAVDAVLPLLLRVLRGGMSWHSFSKDASTLWKRTAFQRHFYFNPLSHSPRS